MAKIPEKPAKRKPTEKKSFSLSDFKKSVGVEDVPNKELEWIKTSQAIQEQTGLPGFPKGYVCLSRGFSNTGKSTSLCEAVVSAQKMNVLPIIIDTENNIGRERLRMMGFDWENDFYIFIDNEFLLEKFGKKENKNRSQASIEDMAEAIHYFLDLQEAGELPYDLLFAIDSLGTLDCIRSINAFDKGSSDNNMWNAGAFERAFKYIMNSRIPASRKQNKKYTNTLIAVQKIWIDSQGAGVVKHKGGEAFFYGARLIYHFGGIATHGTKKVNATTSKTAVQYGVEAKVNVVKNQIDGDMGGISIEEGSIISTPHGFIGTTPEEINDYKKKHIAFFRKILREELTPEEIRTTKIEVLTEDEDAPSAINTLVRDNFDPDTGEVYED